MTKTLFIVHKAAEPCPKCGAALCIRQGKHGKFLGCNNYPKCDYLRPLQGQGSLKILKTLPKNCPKCDNALQLKQGAYGMFIGCSAYPECDFIVQENHATPQASSERCPCPECGKGRIQTKRAKTGRMFYACDNFPACKFTLPAEPVAKPCPKCQFGWMMPLKGKQWQCLNKKCWQRFQIAESEDNADET